jgi:putative flippase GtrA
MNYKVFGQMIRFGLVGLVNTATDWLCYLALTRSIGLYYLNAKIISYIIAASLSFLLNRQWTFAAKEKIAKQLPRFYLTATIGLLLNALILLIVVDLLKLSDILGLVSATLLIFLWNFFSNKLWVFKPLLQEKGSD